MNENGRKIKVTPRIFDTYIAFIRNAPGTKMFRNMYADVDGEKKDITDNGDLSCAFFVSSVLLIFGAVERVHATVVSTVADMERSGWREVEDLLPGDVVVWGEEKGNLNRHKHIGFFLGEGEAISNRKEKKHPLMHSLEMPKRSVLRVLRNEDFRGK